ncbi:hypothetical protein TRFO_11658 [Tritrichomonas foetus]|uniref:Uncharacterized protein n=1 Tax=Tritrichomonas foetus TaxID=1144522 RepID=A0A1J4J2H9_9EUKA|nr:hypothetical protein TRFO_11658 [Tritrichomonas foetus]|eukprot:OHS93656.1 hypothetical protein TRFO_11658 [Tritrichomonas foetus]
MSTFVNKSQIRASFFPGPLSNGCSSWGSCGIFALGAQHSILLYKANTKCIDYLRAVEIQDGSNPTILEFHDKFPYLCIVTDNFTISIFDCVSGHFIGRTRQLGTKILAMKWYNNFIICFTQSNTLLSIDFFDQINGNNLHNINILNNNLNNNNNNNNNSNNDINNYTGNYLSLSPIMVWNVEINENFTNIEIDPFSQTFQVLLYSTISNSFLIINSDSPMHQPMPPFQTQSMTGVSNIVDAVFHPHFKNVIIVLLPSSAIFYELQTKSLRTIISDLPPIFSRIFPSQSDSNELTIYCKDNSFMLFHARENDNTIFEKASSTQLKREQMANPPPLLFAYNQHFMDYLIAVSAQYGIFMLCSNFLGQTK